MQQRHNLSIILAILMNASLHSMQQSLSLHAQAEQKIEHEKKTSIPTLFNLAHKQIAQELMHNYGQLGDQIGLLPEDIQKEFADTVLCNDRELLAFYAQHMTPIRRWSITPTPGENPNVSAKVTSIKTSPCGTWVVVSHTNQTNNQMQLLNAQNGLVSDVILGRADLLEWTSDGKSIVKAGLTEITIIPVNEMGRFQLLAQKNMTFDSHVLCISCSSDSKHIAIVTKKNKAYIYDRDLDVLEEQNLNFEVAAAVYAPQKKQLAYVDIQGTLHLLDCSTGNMVTEVSPQGDDFMKYIQHAWSPNGKTLAITSGGTRYLYDFEVKQRYFGLSFTNRSGDAAISWSPNSKYLAMAGNNILTIWDAQQKLFLIKKEQKGVENGMTWLNNSEILTVEQSQEKQTSLNLFEISFDLTLPQISLVKEMIRQKNFTMAQLFPEKSKALPLSWKNALLNAAKKDDFMTRLKLHFKKLTPLFPGIIVATIVYSAMFLLQKPNSNDRSALISHFYNYILGMGLGAYLYSSYKSTSQA